MKEIKVNPLRKTSIDKAIGQLRAYRLSLENFPHEYTQALQNRLDEILGKEAPTYAAGMWSLYAIVDREGGAEGIIEFDGKVEFIEFGTGVIGKHNHSGINEEWLSKLPPPYTEYNAGPMIHHFDDENQDYWVYNDNGKWVYTQGIEADPFIYRSVKQLMEEHAEIARNVFKEKDIANTVYLFE